jgi:hypothetical protein
VARDRLKKTLLINGRAASSYFVNMGMPGHAHNFLRAKGEKNG